MIIEDHVIRVRFAYFDDKTTIAILTLRNGFNVVGESHCVDPDIYDISVGEEYARQDALRKVETLHGFILQNDLHIKNLHERRGHL